MPVWWCLLPIQCIIIGFEFPEAYTPQELFSGCDELNAILRAKYYVCIPEPSESVEWSAMSVKAWLSLYLGV